MNHEQHRAAVLLLDAFRGRAEYVARATDKGFEPAKLPGPMKPEWLARHLEGQQCAGFYLMDPLSRVRCSCADFDNHPASPDPQWREKATAVFLWLQRAGLTALAEVSQGGAGAHLWLFFDEPVPAGVVRCWWKSVEARTEVPIREIYPRQDVLTGKGLGNLVRYPLWNQSRFVDPENEWAEIAACEALAGIQRTSAAELKDLAFRLGFGELKGEETPWVVQVEPSAKAEAESLELPPRVSSRLSRKGSLLARRWTGDMNGLKDASRSGLVQSIACELVRQYVPTPEIETALRVWCRENGYDKGQRPDWIARTVGAAYEFVLQRVEDRSAGAVTMKDACLSYLDALDRGQQIWLGSGLADLDFSIDGVAPGEMCVIAGRPSHGKSALAMQWLDHAARKGSACLLVSEEMSSLELGKRALTSMSSVEPEDWQRPGRWSPDLSQVLRDDVRRHYAVRAPIHVVESCNSIDRAEDVIDQFCGLHGVNLVAVDYLQLLGSRGNTRYEEVTAISRRLKQAARRNNCAMLALCQQSRESERRPDHEPKLIDLKESGQIEQDADLVLFLQWPHRYDPMRPFNEYIIWAAKRRNGPIRAEKIITSFYPERQQIGPTRVYEREPGEDDGDEEPLRVEAAPGCNGNGQPH